MSSGLVDACRQAFVAFFPAYEMARLRWTALEDPANERRGRLHAFGHTRRLLDHRARVVTTPNNDTLYSSSRLDLRHGPVLVRVPAIAGRYYSLQFLNLHTDNLAILGRRNAGDGPLAVAVAGPGWSGALPAHTHAVQADTQDVWLLVRILVDGADDLPEVAALQDALHIDAPRPVEDYPRQRIAPPVHGGPDGFVDVLGEMLARNPPIGAATEPAAAASAVGIAPGRRWADLPPALQAAWRHGWRAMNDALLDPAIVRSHTIGGWDYPPAELGRWGGNRLLRATTALRGIAALDPHEALYIGAFTDIDGHVLHGGERWRVRVPAGGLPARAFWSLSMYEIDPDGRLFFADNPIGRHAIGNRTRGLRAGGDGAIELVVQVARPADDANWLPAPPGRFRLLLRAYLPEPALVDGLAPLPRVERLRP